jgi:peptidoglycan hydrolase CwlO-like protein
MGFYNGKADRDNANEFDKDDDKDYIVVGGRHSGKQYAYYQNPNAWDAWQPMQPKQIVTGSDYPNMSLADDALNQVTQYVADLQSTIRELHGKLDDAQEEIADYIEMIGEKNEKIEGQAKFIEILQRQIAIAEKYIINDNGRDTRVD